MNESPQPPKEEEEEEAFHQVLAQNKISHLGLGFWQAETFWCSELPFPTRNSMKGFRV
jgi:hypothetical protein